MTDVAREVMIRHVCDCADATEHPGEGDTEHVFRIDGMDFPWFISEKGPVVTRTEVGYRVAVEIIAQSVDVIGLPIEDERT
jgi:hypothetical protein